MFDIAFVLLLCIMSLLAFIKGFVRSLFSVVNWIVAALVSYLLTPYLATIFSQDYPPVVLHSVVSMVLFIVTMVVLTILTSSMSKTFLTVIPKSVDQSLGFAFGFTKGYLIAALIFSVIGAVYSSGIGLLNDKVETEDGRIGPSWLVEAKSYKVLGLASKLWSPAVSKISDMLGDREVKKNVDNFQDKIDESGGDSFDKVKKIQDLYDNVDALSGGGDIEKGYHKKEIEKMNRLIEAIE